MKEPSIIKILGGQNKETARNVVVFKKPVLQKKVVKVFIRQGQVINNKK